MSKIKNIIFDLDGTLWDSRKQVLDAWKEVLPNIISKKLTIDTLNNLMGKTNDEYIKFLFPNIDSDDAKTLMNKCEQQEVFFLNSHGANLYKGTLDTIINLSKNCNLFIVSNCQKGYIESFLNFYNLNLYFQDIECNGNTNLNKADNINLIIKRNKLVRQNTCYVGDTNGDYTASLTNKIIFIYAKYGFGICNKQKYTLNNIIELIDIINNL